MADIFISYASEDRDRVIPIVKGLEAQGWSTFWDWRSIPVAKTWRQLIREGLVEARCVLVLWSRKSIESEWVIEEAEFGKKQKILIPVLIDEVDPPIGFGQIQAARLTGWKGESDHTGFQQLIKALTDSLGPPKAKAIIAESSKKAHPEPKPIEASVDKIKRAEPEPSELKHDIVKPPRKSSIVKIGVLITIAIVIAVGVGLTIFLGKQTVEPPPPLPTSVTINIPVQINGNIFEKIKATHTYFEGSKKQGTIVFKFLKKTNKKPIDVVVEKARGGEITTSGHINKNGVWREQGIPLSGLAGEQIKIFRWAPNAIGIMGSGGGDAFLTLPFSGNVEISIAVKD